MCSLAVVCGELLQHRNFCIIKSAGVIFFKHHCGGEGGGEGELNREGDSI